MATTTTVNTTYAGEFAGDYISAALLSGNTLANSLISVKLNVAHKEVIKSLDYGSAIKDATCDWAAEGTITLDERVLEPRELQVNIQSCNKDSVVVHLDSNKNDIQKRVFYMSKDKEKNK